MSHPRKVRTLPEVSFVVIVPPAEPCRPQRPAIAAPTTGWGQPPATRGAPSHPPARDRHGRSPESGPRSVSPCAAPLPVPTVHHPAAGAQCRGTPRQPGNASAEETSVTSVLSWFFPVARGLSRLRTQGVSKETRWVRRDAGRAGGRGAGRGGQAGGSQRAGVAGLAREPLGTARVTRGGRELSAARGWRTSAPRGVEGGLRLRDPAGCGCWGFVVGGAAWRDKRRRKVGSFHQRAGETA